MRAPVSTVENNAIGDVRCRCVRGGGVFRFAALPGFLMKLTSEGRLGQLDATLKMISVAGAVLLQASGEHELYQGMCEAITAQGLGFALAWVGVPLNDARKSVEVVACAGPAKAYLDGIDVTWDLSPQGSGPTGRAIRTGTAQFNNRMQDAADFRPWLASARRSGLASSFSLPIKLSNGRVVAALMVYSSTIDAFGPQEMGLLSGLSDHLGFGVETLRVRIAHEKALTHSIEALAHVLELRDPYTAGHGRRVAELAVAIGRRLGYSQSRLEGLRLAAMVHDIGKIRVPLEILVYPGKLSSVERALIQVHPVVGFEVLRQLDDMWPVATAVRQHHERLDGSGYPDGLRGDEIVHEARIIAVADLVESMASHRPYREALGTDVALAEIRRESGTKFDADVVSACIHVFEVEGFCFETQGPPTLLQEMGLLSR